MYCFEAFELVVVGGKVEKNNEIGDEEAAVEKDVEVENTGDYFVSHVLKGHE